MSAVENKSTSLNLNDLNSSQSFLICFNLLNKAQSKGVFTMDEAVLAKFALEKVKKELNVILPSVPVKSEKK